MNSIAEYINEDAVNTNISSVLGDRTPQFITSVVSLVNSSETLKSADYKSVMGACLIAASLNLPINPNLGFAFIIPYKDNKTNTTQAQFQMGYKGFIQLAQRSGQFRTINASDVREGEFKGIDRLTGELSLFWHNETEREKLKVVGYVAYFKLKNGFEKSLYMTVEELTQHGIRFSQSMKKGFGLWKEDFDAMAKKTVIKLLLSKYAPMDSNLSKAQEADQAIVKDGFKYIDNLPESSDTIARGKERERILTHIKECKSIEELEQCAETVKNFGELNVTEAYIEKEEKLGVKNG